MYWILPIVFLLVWFLATEKRYRWIYIIYKTLPRDIMALYRFIKLNLGMRNWDKAQMTIPKVFAKVVEKHPNRVAFYFEDETWTYQRLDEFSNKVANFFIAQGYEKGDTIALLLENRPEYVGLWLGLSKAGLITALINTNLVSLPLYHSVTVANSKTIIYGTDFISAIQGVKDRLPDVKLYEFKTSNSNNVIEGSVDLADQLRGQSILRPTVQISALSPRDKVIYIFTSGTTGLPKAANISHSRYMYVSLALYECINLNEYDIFYNPLPLYHSSGGMVAVGQTLLFGISGVIRRKFSASNFWTDCLKYKCTVANYIGETCRYILAAHKDGINFRHKVKKMTGNGLRKEIWQKFMDTFNIAEIYEFYGATEGNANIANMDNTVGAVGFVPVYSSQLYPVSLIRCHEDTKEPIRDKNGHCIRCKPGEPGIMIGKIVRNNHLNEFTGYVDKKETGKKVLTDVFEEGDAFFNTGDMLVQDELGYFYFKDRTGDTYRWKGENVATGEVESVLSGILGLTELVVYGVEVPGNEGRAGMITVLDTEKNLNLDELARGLRTHLPSYAIPLFLRITDTLPMTGTFKVKKVELQKEGFNMEVVKDPLYFYDAKNIKYVPLSQVYSDIVNGTRKL